MDKKNVGNIALKFLEKKAEQNASKFCRAFIYEPAVPRKLITREKE